MNRFAAAAARLIQHDPHARLALEIIEELNQSGFTAYLAGGCVRDALLDHRPKDYDVATDARPEQIRQVFGGSRTLPIGVSFGVVCVLPPKGSKFEPVEVATFRRDGNYTDGRRPDTVHFSGPELDAQRRDFTINGMFLDPRGGEVIDFVGGCDDLDARQIRAIGDPHARFAEDKLRLLRAVRFATTYQFQIDAATRRAVIQHANDVTVCSGERIGAEMRKLLTSPHAGRGVALLVDTHLAKRVLPPVAEPLGEAATREALDSVLRNIESADVAPRIAAVALVAGTRAAAAVGEISRLWKLSNDETAAARWCVEHWPLWQRADALAWSQLQPLLVHPHAPHAVALLRALAAGQGECVPARDRVDRELQRPAERLNPQPLITGEDLIAAGRRPGPQFKAWLQAAREAQLEGRLQSREQAMQALDRGELDPPGDADPPAERSVDR